MVVMVDQPGSFVSPTFSGQVHDVHANCMGGRAEQAFYLQQTAGEQIGEGVGRGQQAGLMVFRVESAGQEERFVAEAERADGH